MMPRTEVSASSGSIAVSGGVWPLTGRAEELALIADATADSNSAAGVVIAGAAGVGKTRLAREALDAAGRRGRSDRWFVATNSARTVPLGVFAETVDSFGPDRLRRVQEVIDAVTRTDSPARVVIGIDDAHLLDEQSALVVHQLVQRRLATVVATVRTGEPVPDAVTALWKDELLPRLDLQPLSARETAALLECVLGGQVDSASADRVWHYTRGNALFLRQLMSDNLAAGWITKRSGVWVWHCGPEISPTLTELVDSTIGCQPAAVTRVLDVLAVADQLESAVLADLTGAGAVDAAEAAGLISIDTDGVQVARLAHPLFGEIRRARAGTMRLRHLRGRVAAALAKRDTAPDLIQTVRRAVLVLDSDMPPDPRLLMDASVAALKLMDPVVAERLAARAVQTGGGPAAQLIHVSALVNCDRLGDALDLNAELIRAASSDNDRVLRTISRAGILVRIGAADDAEQLLDTIRNTVGACGLRRPFESICAVLHAMRGRPKAAIDAATSALNDPGWLDDSSELLAVFGLVSGLGDLGRLDVLSSPAQHGYELARASLDTPMLRFFLGLHHLDALHLGGLISEANELAARLAQEPMDLPLARSVKTLACGITAAAQGDFASARRWFREAMATGADLETPWLSGMAQVWLATAIAKTGDHQGAAIVLAEQHRDVCPRLFSPQTALAQAWVCAAGGVMSEAIVLVRAAAERAHDNGQAAVEVLCLQTAAQFGDPTVGVRLTELAAIVQGPRVVAAAAHAVALRDRDGEGLLFASRSYEAFGDRVAAADAAAQAAVVLRDIGRRGAAMTATAVARRLAVETGAETPALRANAAPIPLTRRQREIIALAAVGLSNREIAERLVMSIRTVEGHLFRASQNTGASGRAALVTLLHGASTKHERGRVTLVPADRPSQD